MIQKDLVLVDEAAKAVLHTPNSTAKTLSHSSSAKHTPSVSANTLTNSNRTPLIPLRNAVSRSINATPLSDKTASDGLQTPWDRVPFRIQAPTPHSKRKSPLGLQDSNSMDVKRHSQFFTGLPRSGVHPDIFKRQRTYSPSSDPFMSYRSSNIDSRYSLQRTYSSETLGIGIWC